MQYERHHTMDTSGELGFVLLQQSLIRTRYRCAHQLLTFSSEMKHMIHL